MIKKSSGQGVIPDRRWLLLGNVLFHTLKEVRERKLMWCDSTTDSIVWMGEDERRIDWQLFWSV